MSRLRSSMVLLGICVVALLIGTLRVVTQRTPLPTGSSYSAQPDGAQAAVRLDRGRWRAARAAFRTSRCSDARAATTLLVLAARDDAG